MAAGNGYGFKYNDKVSLDTLFGYNYGAFIIETSGEIQGEYIGDITLDRSFVYGDSVLSCDTLDKAYETKLESVFPCLEQEQKNSECEKFTFTGDSVLKAPAVKSVRPKVLIPVFPGTNCEFDTTKVMEDAGADVKQFVINNLSSDGISSSTEKFAKEISDSQMIFIPGGFSGGDEPDGSGKFIMALFRNAGIKEQVENMLYKRDGLMCGICNGFQALIKLGLVPYGRIIDTDENCPTLTFNTIARHQSKLVRIRICSNKSPWLKGTEVGDIYTVPISHGEGRFMASKELVDQLASNGQIATQYVDLDGEPTYDIRYNPNGSFCAIEGITSPDGRVFGKMGHSERIGKGLYKNVPGVYNMYMFESAVKYFR